MELAGVDLGFDGTITEGKSPNPKMNKRMEVWGAWDIKVDLWSWKLAWLGVAAGERGQEE